MKIDPLVSLACSIQAKKGVYALLLGSGVSRTSGIPTGWEITLDLIKKMAVLYGENEVTDPVKWYTEKYESDPDYSYILDKLAKTPVERNNLLKAYFEPSDDNTDVLHRKPTKAHKAIAQLIKDEYIRIVITTNFDRLLESALTEIGIVPNVISNTDQLEGAMPLIHSTCTILKVHGDYMDMRIKNTVIELSEYTAQINDYIDRIFDEFGLIVCGWSGEWDIALRNCIFRTKNNRFSYFWLKKGNLGELAQEIINFKSFELIDIEGADNFFVELKDKIDSLSDLTMRQSPLSISLACATLKRLLPDNKNNIRTSDLIMDTTKDLINNINKLDWSSYPEYTVIKQRIEQLENISKPLLHLISLGCYWGDNSYEQIWINCFKVIFNVKPLSTNGIYIIWENLFYYPAFLTMYAILMSCIESGHYDLLYKILNNVKSSKESRYEKPVTISSLLYPARVIERDVCNKALYQNNKHTPVSERAFDVLREPILQIVNNEDEYNALYDKAEYLFAVNYWYNESLDEKKGLTLEKSWAPIGRFGYKFRDGWKVENILDYEFTLKDEWSAIKVGFFGASFDNFIKCNDAIKKWLSNSSIFF
jgi:hypothetical protein